MRCRCALSFAGSLAGLVACRIGGPTESPDEYVSFPDATADHAVALMTTPTGDDGPSTPPGAATGSDAPADDLEGGGGDFDSALDDLSDGGCSSTVAVCDPVHNTGCNPFQQCDIDPSQASTPTGLCLFGGGTDAGTCLATIFTESCPPNSTCVDGGCRTLCFCNGDCPVGECCSDRSGPPGFTMCGGCP
jgi:hypothetical protein